MHDGCTRYCAHRCAEPQRAKVKPHRSVDNRQRRSRQQPTNATTRPANGARSTAICTKTAPQPPTADNSPPRQPPDPLTERDLLQFTIRQRRSRQQPTTKATTRPSNGARSTAIYNKTAPQPPTAAQGNHQTLQRSEIYCNLQ